MLLANILFRTASFAVFTYFVAFLVQSYGLTQSETAVPLGCVGLGAMLGSFLGGWVARLGRRLYWAAAGLAAGGLCLGLALDGGTAADRSTTNLRLIGRRSPVRTHAEADALITKLGASLASQFPEENAGTTWRVI